MAYGGDQELVAALRTRDRQVWGSLSLYREPDRPRFDRDDLDFLRAVAPVLADGVRRGLLVGEASDPEGPDGPGCWCSPNDGPWNRCHPVSSGGCAIFPTAPGTPAGCRRRCWRWPVGRSPSRRRRRPPTPAGSPIARVLTRSGTWVVLHGVPLIAGGLRRVAVIVEPAHPARISPLLMSAYRLTEREQELTRLVLQGIRRPRSPSGW